MGLPSAAARKAEGRKLLEWGFRNVTAAKLFDVGETVSYARVWGGDRFYASLRAQGDLSVYLPRAPANPRLGAEVIYEGPLKAPIKKGDRVASLRVTSESGAVNEVALYAVEDIGRASFLARGVDSLAYIVGDWMGERISALLALAVPEPTETAVSAQESPGATPGSVPSTVQ